MAAAEPFRVFVPIASKPIHILFVSSLDCPFAQRTWITLLEKKIPFQRVDVNLQTPKPPWLLRMNPLGKVPILGVSEKEIKGPENFHGEIVCESLICNEYLEDQFPNPTLLPPTPIERAHCRFLIEQFGHRVVPEYFRVLSKKTSEDRQHAANNLRTEFQNLNRRLEGKENLMGDQFTLADAVVYPVLARMEVLLHFRGEHILPWWTKDFETSNLKRWMEAVSHRPSIVTLENEVKHKSNQEYQAFLIQTYAQRYNKTQS